MKLLLVSDEGQVLDSKEGVELQEVLDFYGVDHPRLFPADVKAALKSETPHICAGDDYACDACGAARP